MQTRVSGDKALKEEEYKHGGPFYVYLIVTFNIFQTTILRHWWKK